MQCFLSLRDPTISNLHTKYGALGEVPSRRWVQVDWISIVDRRETMGLVSLKPGSLSNLKQVFRDSPGMFCNCLFCDKM